MSEESLNERKRANLRKYNEESNRVTRESVEDALLLLMEEKPFDTISITDIVTRAGVSRSAYYRNYASKEAILSAVFAQSVDTIMEALRPPMMKVDAKDVYLRLFETVRAEVRIFKIILNANMEWMFLTEVNHRLIRRIPSDRVAERYRLCSWIGATVNILFTWIRQGLRETPEQMAEICSEESESRFAPYIFGA